jgi:SAM-dependent methyltransferase
MVGAGRGPRAHRFGVLGTADTRVVVHPAGRAGWFTRRLAREVAEVVAFEPDGQLVEAARSAQTPEHVTFVHGGVAEVSTRGPFDAVLCLDVIEHIEDDRGALAELRAALRPGGTLVLSVPAHAWLFGARDRALGHFRRYSRTLLLDRLTTAGFTPDRCGYWNALGVRPYFLYEQVLKREVYDGLRTGRDSGARRAMRAALRAWLIGEGSLPLPLGLSLLVRAH